MAHATIIAWRQCLDALGVDERPVGEELDDRGVCDEAADSRHGWPDIAGVTIDDCQSLKASGGSRACHVADERGQRRGRERPGRAEREPVVGRAEWQARQQRDIARAALGSAIADGLCRGEIEARHEVGAMLLGRANCPERRRAGGGEGAYFGCSEQSETMRSHGDTIVL